MNRRKRRKRDLAGWLLLKQVEWDMAMAVQVASMRINNKKEEAS